ncbi:hypothetical protein DL764_001024 [Monosporascus ibericus]|uniref:Uncharacterized protein n=1 Tax=Monosporascus ibericus TaxID=155417 RepID=A0A4Q4TW83_9PEZI|nr:hypothetical protein DL764_001024 [Monosporascus ibericus]
MRIVADLELVTAEPVAVGVGVEEALATQDLRAVQRGRATSTQHHRAAAYAVLRPGLRRNAMRAAATFQGVTTSANRGSDGMYTLMGRPAAPTCAPSKHGSICRNARACSSARPSGGGSSAIPRAEARPTR